MQLNVILYNDSVDTVALEQVGNVKAGARTNFAAAFRAIEEFVAVGAVAVLFLSDGFDTSNEDYWSELDILNAQLARSLRADGATLLCIYPLSH